jgi:DNA-binding response OmpR family regulator
MSESQPSGKHVPVKESILIVDHNAEVGDIVCEILTEEGFKATAAHDLDAAVELLSSVKYGLIIANYMESAYRRDDRWPILELIRGLAGEETPIIVLTTSPIARKQGAQRLGVADVVEKPFELDDLVTRVMNVVRNVPAR